jgi:hypothetical protein
LPFVRPVTVIGEAVGPDIVPVAGPAPPSLDVHVAVYEVIGLPLSLGAENVTVVCAGPRATVGCAGAAGATAHAGTAA